MVPRDERKSEKMGTSLTQRNINKTQIYLYQILCGSCAFLNLTSSVVKTRNVISRSCMVAGLYHFVFSSFRGEKTKWHSSATIVSAHEGGSFSNYTSTDATNNYKRSQMETLVLSYMAYKI